MKNFLPPFFYSNIEKIMIPATLATETELSSVNSILGAIGQSPVSRIYNKTNGEFVYINPEIAVLHQILKEVDKVADAVLDMTRGTI